jgi:ssDNA-binding Zn-finger/Zn-ribbon topoisomerase 1
MLKRLLNNPERITYGRLCEVCARHGAEVYAKVRLADVLPIEGSNLTDALYEFALQAHYDFVVAGRDQVPLFAVEFDGPQHDHSQQTERDVKKNEVSRRFSLPLLRVRAGDLCRSESRLDRLTEVIERWFEDRPKSAMGDGSTQHRPSCPVCGAEMVETDGKYGRFLSCVRFPSCRGSRDLPRPANCVNILRRRRVLITILICAAFVVVMLALFSRFQFGSPSDNPVCPNCGSRMVLRYNAKTGHPFLGCSEFPRCRGTRDVQHPTFPAKPRAKR